MKQPKISYKSFCWVLGTTSFRTAKLNLKIEQQLLLLDKLYKQIQQQGKEWDWNPDLQTIFYDLMHEEGFLVGNAPRKDKDARQKTSGLVDIGFVTEKQRLLTKAGYALLAITKQNDFTPDNPLHLSKDSFIYFKQMLKATLKIDKDNVRPYFILAHLLSELNELSFNEFRYFLPLCISKETTIQVIQIIKDYRSHLISLEEAIYKHLMQLENYKMAYEVFLEEEVTEKLICNIGMNRKSANYDKTYYPAYLSLKNYFLDQKGTEIELFLSIKNIKQDTKWRNLIFKTPNQSAIKKQDRDSIKGNCPFLNLKNEREFKAVFFKYLHIFKAMATLEDYFDLNCRYFNLTDTLVFADNKVKFDLIPQYFFRDCHQALFDLAFTPCTLITEDIDLEKIHPSLLFNAASIYQRIYQDYGIAIENSEQAAQLIQDERHNRFNQLIDKHFGKEVLLNLLTYFKNRDDDKIVKIVTDEADIPTIFEYILAIIWYELSERKGNILKYMNLSLSADLLPKTHASGGAADIVYEYEANYIYPKHSLLIEATLAENSNQRRMEMEPVSRHLGNYRLKSNNPHDYCVFVTTDLHINVIADFRGRKLIPYYDTDTGEEIIGLKIIPIDTVYLQDLLRSNTTYDKIYPFFEKQYQSELQGKRWHETMLQEQQAEYRIGK
ncbi:TPA: AlwI family type II restriction endonuclease [Neisseria subflava]